MAARSAICARCGYDLSGVVNSWSDSCPLEGTCSECGLALDWRDVLRPGFRVPKWFFEHRYPRPIAGPIGTFWRSLLPWSYWAEVQLTWPIRPGRLIIFACALVAVAHVVLTGASVYFEYHSIKMLMPGFGASSRLTEIGLWPYGSTPSPYLGSELLLLTGPAWTVILANSLTPLAYFALPQTLAQARIRKAHLLRGWAYSWIPLVVAAAALALHAVGLTAFRALLQILPVPTLIGTTTACWLILHWFFFTRRYLRLPNALGVTACMLSIATLLSLIVVVVWSTHNSKRWLM